MSFATLFAARAFPGAGRDRFVRFFLTANGLLVPFLIFQMYFHSLLWVASLWAITFPASTILLARRFRRANTRRQAASAAE
jgi:hypothetical protein